MAFSYVAITAIVTAVFQFCFFVIAATLKIDKVTDFAGTLNFVILAVLTFLLKGTYHFRQAVLTAFVVVWGLRLGIFLLLRLVNGVQGRDRIKIDEEFICKPICLRYLVFVSEVLDTFSSINSMGKILAWGEDNRFDEKRTNLVKFAIFWFLQGVWVWTVHLPVTVVNEVSRNPGLKPQDFGGWAMWSIGMVIEAIADQSKLNYKKDPKNKGRWTDAGLWSWSRHPNYFGEILLWWGVFLAATPVLEGGQWSVIAGPILLTVLLLFVSGIPILETSADKRHGGKPDYLQYKKQTSPLIPLPPAFYGSLPQWVKTVFLFEFPLYSTKLAAGKEQLQSENLSDEA